LGVDADTDIFAADLAFRRSKKGGRGHSFSKKRRMYYAQVGPSTKPVRAEGVRRCALYSAALQSRRERKTHGGGGKRGKKAVLGRGKGN